MNQLTQSSEHLGPERLNAFVDGELSSAERQGIEQHFAVCHACALRVLSVTQLKSATAHASRRFATSPEALARLTAHLNSQSLAQAQIKRPTRLFSMPSLRPLVWTALAAAVLLTVSVLGWRQLHQSNSLAAELLDQHLATLSSGVSPQVISTDRHTVKPWFQGRLPFSFNLPDTSALPEGIALKGANLTYLDGQPAALLLFTIHKHEVSVFLTQRAASSRPTALSTTRAGFTIQTAASPDLRIVAVSDVNPVELNNLVTVLVTAQSHE